ncbi:MAG: hypothetical protein JNN07_04135 [Verrucomicrobiales bacterium]|nr:hypothetical protein [Verrucomicrobiales bacterium]
MKPTIQSIVSALLFITVTVVSSGQTWDATSGYSGVKNPNGVWSFGRKWSVETEAMDLLTRKWGTDGWYMAGTKGSPSIMHLNWSTVMPGPFMWNGDNRNGYCTVRWTCPLPGKYTVEGEFYGADSRDMDSHVYLVIDGTLRYSNHVQRAAQAAPFSEAAVDLSPGDPVDFVIVWGGTGDPGTSSVTGLGAVITRVYAPATGTASVVNGFVVGVTMGEMGAGYTNTPIVRFIGGGGSGARAQATVSNGVVTAVTILNPGKGYTTPPVVVIAPPYVSPPRMQIAPMRLVSFTNLTEGTRYQAQTFAQGEFSDLNAAFTATNSAFTLAVPGGMSSNLYRLAVAPAPVQAQATAQVFGGFVTGATVTRGGSGYGTNIPAVSILSNGAGSNAMAVATVNNGIVVGITITDPGIGYANGARMIIAAPPTVELWPQKTSKAVQLDVTLLSPYDNYRSQFTPLLGGAWIDLGEPFTPTATALSQFQEIVGEGGFYRVIHEP